MNRDPENRSVLLTPAKHAKTTKVAAMLLNEGFLLAGCSRRLVEVHWGEQTEDTLLSRMTRREPGDQTSRIALKRSRSEFVRDPSGFHPVLDQIACNLGAKDLIMDSSPGIASELLQRMAEPQIQSHLGTRGYCGMSLAIVFEHGYDQVVAAESMLEQAEERSARTGIDRIVLISNETGCPKFKVDGPLDNSNRQGEEAFPELQLMSIRYCDSEFWSRIWSGSLTLAAACAMDPRRAAERLRCSEDKALSEQLKLLRWFRDTIRDMRRVGLIPYPAGNEGVAA